MTPDLARFRLLDQARQKRVFAQQLRQLLAAVTVGATVSFLVGAASGLEADARQLEARASVSLTDDGLAEDGPAEL